MALNITNLNGVRQYVNTAITTTDTSITLNAGLAPYATAPALTIVSDFYYLTLLDFDNPTKWEVVKVVSRVGSDPGPYTYTVERNIDSSTGLALEFFSNAIAQWSPGVLEIDRQPGDIVQTSYLEYNEPASGIQLMNLDDSIPQITEGDEYMALTFTPVSATNKIGIEVNIHLSSNISTNIITALFKDNLTDSIAASPEYGVAIDSIERLRLYHELIANTTNQLRFSLRAGGVASGTTTMNGVGGVRVLGGVINSYIKIIEFKG